ncbi:MAG: DNA translocase FtsK 4TM domain-containing protein [Thiothrix sp.]|nr:DNA translocase FtsK 4TM domain-containing protein [Thiothrix sp.]HPE61680.1 DNA translocase FtsK 4TM domain-containing protein [Thiolinea sp.]
MQRCGNFERKQDLATTDIKLNQRKRASLQQATFILSLGVAIVFMLALLTFNPADPGWFHPNNSHQGNCANMAGCKGAWVADLLYGLLGYFALAIPVIFVLMGLTAFRSPTKSQSGPSMGGINTLITIAGALLTLLAGSGLAHMLFVPYPQGIGGGVIGAMVAHLFTGTVLGFYGSLVVLLSLFLGGITLVADISWVDLTEKTGDLILRLVDRLQYARSDTGKGGTAPGLSLNRDLLGYSRKSVGKITDLLQKARDLAANSPLNRRNPVALEADIYRQRDPLFETTRIPSEARYPESEPVDEPAPRETREPSAAITVSEAVPAKSRQPLPRARAASSLVEDFILDEKPGSDNHAGMFILPRLSLLNPPPPARERVTQTKAALDQLSGTLIESLGHYGIKGAEVVARDPGPVITRFELQLPDGTKASKVSGLANDLARNMCVSSVRVVEVIPGRPTIGIEIPNEKRDVVTISEMLESQVFKKSHSPLTLALGKDIQGNPVVADLARMPHLLVAGTTGSGKSVAVNAMLLSLLYKATPEEVRMILIDPKMLELSSYEHIPHLLSPVVTDMKEAASALRWCVAEMERRYLLMSKLRVRNIAGFNLKIQDAQERGEEIPDPLFDPATTMDMQPKALEPMPYIVIVIDEFADMMMIVGKKVEELIARLAQKARAAGIHLVLATQRPSVDVITGLIKANIPTRVAFQVSTRIDSRTILDQGGAEQLLGYGDMLYLPPGTSMPQRVHGALVTDQEVEDVATYLKQQREPEYIEGVLADTEGASDAAIPGLEPLDGGEEADPLYDEAVYVVTESRRASISYLQRRLKVGYNRAARMIEDMEIAGVVSPVQANGTREVLAAPPVAD